MMESGGVRSPQVTESAETWFGGSVGPKTNIEDQILSYCLKTPGFIADFHQKSQKFMKSSRVCSSLILWIWKETLKISIHDQVPGYAEPKFQSSSSKDKKAMGKNRF